MTLRGVTACFLLPATLTLQPRTQASPLPAPSLPLPLPSLCVCRLGELLSHPSILLSTSLDSILTIIRASAASHPNHVLSLAAAWLQHVPAVRSQFRPQLLQAAGLMDTSGVPPFRASPHGGASPAAAPSELRPEAAAVAAVADPADRADLGSNEPDAAPNPPRPGGSVPARAGAGEGQEERKNCADPVPEELPGSGSSPVSLPGPDPGSGSARGQGVTKDPGAGVQGVAPEPAWGQGVTKDPGAGAQAVAPSPSAPLHTASLKQQEAAAATAMAVADGACLGSALGHLGGLMQTGDPSALFSSTGLQAPYASSTGLQAPYASLQSPYSSTGLQAPYASAALPSSLGQQLNTSLLSSGLSHHDLLPFLTGASLGNVAGGGGGGGLSINQLLQLQQQQQQATAQLLALQQVAKQQQQGMVGPGGNQQQQAQLHDMGSGLSLEQLQALLKLGPSDMLSNPSLQLPHALAALTTPGGSGLLGAWLAQAQAQAQAQIHRAQAQAVAAAQSQGMGVVGSPGGGGMSALTWGVGSTGQFS